MPVRPKPVATYCAHLANHEASAGRSRSPAPVLNAWCGRPPSSRTVQDAPLTIRAREAHERSRRTYGSPRVHVKLAETHQVFVSRKRVTAHAASSLVRANATGAFLGSASSIPTPLAVRWAQEGRGRERCSRA
ncbi:transposase [Anaeromyxobacter sp. Fw109-5]|uniref:transposase n=1 Tax=Anaeromyxobacter sp. (strain Fw109-5) TaxID=404589 RepID=UPI00351076B0